MKNETLVFVSPVEPVYNKKGKITVWRISAKYIVSTPMGRPSQLCFYSTKEKEYCFRNMFGWGYNCVCRLRAKLLAQLEQQKR